MLPCVCSVIDHRWRENVVRTKKWHTRRKPSVSLMFLPHFDVFCDLLLNRRMATWNLFVSYNKETNYHRKSFFSKSFNMTRKLAFAPYSHHFDKLEKKPFDVIWSIQNEAISLVAMRSKELWLVEKNHATVKPDSSVASRGMKLTAKAKLNCEIYKSWRKCWKSRASFCHQSSPVSWIAWTLPWILQELKK